MECPTHLLAATDLSAPARHACERAYRLAADNAACLTLLHVVSQGAVDALRDLLGQQSAPVETRVLDEARRRVQELADEFGPRWEVSASVLVRAGWPLREIPGQADALDASLLVIGARGEGFLQHLLLGTTAERLLGKTRRPLLAVKQRPHDAYRRVLVPIDFSPWSAPAVRAASRLAPAAEILLLHAFTVPFESTLRLAAVDDVTIYGYREAAREEARQRVHELAAEVGLGAGDYRCLVSHGDASPVILEQEQLHDCDLIVLGKHGKGVVEELLLGSVTKHVLAEAGGDVLVTGGA